MLQSHTAPSPGSPSDVSFPKPQLCALYPLTAARNTHSLGASMAGGLARTTSSTKCSQWASGPRTAVLGSFLFPSLGCFRGPLGCSLTPGAVPRWGQAGKAPRAHRMGEAASKAASGGLEGTAGPATALREAPRPCGTRPAPGAPPEAAASAPGRPRQPPSWGCLRQRSAGPASGRGERAG